jgi:hypothetical protein
MQDLVFDRAHGLQYYTGGELMFKENEFNAALARAGKTRGDLAKELNINMSTLWRKINNDGSFTRKEINTIIEFLQIDDPASIFFSE